jgi:predicted transposase YdaD
MKSLAVRQVYQRGLRKGERKGERRGERRGILKDAQEMVLEALDERFGVVSSSLIDQIRALKRPEVLKSLLRQALRCPNLANFQEILTQVK